VLAGAPRVHGPSRMSCEPWGTSASIRRWLLNGIGPIEALR
jgi:hypothetical protein